MRSGIATFYSVLRHEGPRAVFDRISDRREGRARLQRMQRVSDGRGASESRIGPAPVVNISPVPPFPRRGGAQIQLLDRLEAEVGLRTVAHLYPGHEAWHLECRTPGHAELRVIDVSLDDPVGSLASTRRAVATALRIAETEIVHIENAYGFPLELSSRLRDDGCRVVLSVHDFSLYCRRPHLIAEPGQQFCGFESDLQRCRECLAEEWLIEPGMLSSHRTTGASALSAAERVVFPSDTHRDRHLILFTDVLDARRTVVINPATAAGPAHEATQRARPHIAVVGGLKRHKGGALVGRVLEGVRESIRDVQCTVFGDCDPELVAPIRRQPGLRIRGYYRAGRLPALLGEAGATIALFPSLAAESYGLVVDECLYAGVPVVAFDTGEVGDRLRRLRAGVAVDRTEGASGLAAAIVAAADEHLTVPDAIADRLPTPAGVARQFLELYEGLNSND